MRRLALATALVAALLTVGAHQALAHHAFAAEGLCNAPVALSGKVSAVEWINPHTWIHLTVSEPGRAPQAWMFGGGAPNTLRRMGLNEEVLKPGVSATLHGWQTKDTRCLEAAATHVPTCKAEGYSVTFLDGKTVFFGGSGVGLPAPPDAWPKAQTVSASGFDATTAGSYGGVDGLPCKTAAG
jgi:hypothetical protein